MHRRRVERPAQDRESRHRHRHALETPRRLEWTSNRCYYRTCQQLPRRPATGTKFSEDVIPITDLKGNPGRVVRHAAEAHRPVLLTSRGRGVAVVQSVTDYEAAEEERAFMRAVITGLADLEAGRELSLADAKARLGLK